MTKGAWVIRCADRQQKYIATLRTCREEGVNSRKSKAHIVPLVRAQRADVSGSRMYRHQESERAGITLCRQATEIRRRSFTYVAT